MIALSTFAFIVILFLCANIFFFTGYLWKRKAKESEEVSFWRNACLSHQQDIFLLQDSFADLKEENEHLKTSLNIYAEQLSVGG